MEDKDKIKRYFTELFFLCSHQWWKADQKGRWWCDQLHTGFQLTTLCSHTRNATPPSIGQPLLHANNKPELCYYECAFQCMCVCVCTFLHYCMCVCTERRSLQHIRKLFCCGYLSLFESVCVLQMIDLCVLWISSLTCCTLGKVQCFARLY